MAGRQLRRRSAPHPALQHVSSGIFYICCRTVPAAANHDVGLPPAPALRLSVQVCCPWTAACQLTSLADKGTEIPAAY